ncbi:hypothetical protein AB0M57_04955 [Streptomyces sp. NPDC051597]|uniref:hypothetical protein n=1 Tax=Streptomyces sp. NPDC051597 TaxID=3155049 RepID=UPI00343EF5D4
MTPHVTAPGTRITPAGVDWDAVRVTRFHALRALAHLDHPGSVVVDPSSASPALVFFVPPGASKGWQLPQSEAFGEATHLEIPAGDKDRPPGLYWLVKPTSGWRIQHIQVEQLRQALEVVLREAGGQSAEEFRADVRICCACQRVIKGDAEIIPRFSDAGAGQNLYRCPLGTPDCVACPTRGGTTYRR